MLLPLLAAGEAPRKTLISPGVARMNVLLLWEIKPCYHRWSLVVLFVTKDWIQALGEERRPSGVSGD